MNSQPLPDLSSLLSPDPYTPSFPEAFTQSHLPKPKVFPVCTGHHQPCFVPFELRRETWASLPLSTVHPELLLSLPLQALDGAFTEENRAQCRAATAPLLEAVDNLSAFASNPEFSSVPAQISPEVRQGEGMNCWPPHLVSRSLETHPSASPLPRAGLPWSPL